MSRLDLIRERAPAIYDQASVALGAQGEAITSLAEAKRVYGASATTAGRLARELLSVVCEDTTVPMIERAGWSTALHGHHNTFASVDDFAAKASEYQEKLEAIDGALREPGAPILAINPGQIGDPHYSRGSVLRYAVSRSDGSGLHIRQSYNDGQKWHYHWAHAPEEQKRRGRSVYQGFNAGDPSSPLISNITTDSLARACVRPAEAVPIVRGEGDSKVDSLYVIGEAQIAAFFDEAASMFLDPKFDMLRGAVAFAGVTL